MHAFDFEGAVGQTLRVRHTSTSNRVISLAEVQVEGNIDESQVIVNGAMGKTASQSTTCYGGVASRAVDGNAAASWGDKTSTHTCGNQAETWWKVDLESSFSVDSVHFTNRYDCCWDRLTNPIIELLDSSGNVIASQSYAGMVPWGATVSVDFGGIYAYQVRIVLEGNGRILTLAEVAVYGKYDSGNNVMTLSPSTTPSVTPQVAETETPSAAPSFAPSATPVVAATETPSASPQAAETETPSATPVVAATEKPSASPQVAASNNPTNPPQVSASNAPSSSPQIEATAAPSSLANQAINDLSQFESLSSEEKDQVVDELKALLETMT
jgi:hypothetical protein